MSLAKDGINQKIYRATLTRVQDRARQLRAADPLHREVTFNQALDWMLNKMDELDQQEDQG